MGAIVFGVTMVAAGVGIVAGYETIREIEKEQNLYKAADFLKGMNEAIKFARKLNEEKKNAQ